MADEIRHERNIILQCVRYIVNNNFFDVEVENSKTSYDESNKIDLNNQNVTEDYQSKSEPQSELQLESLSDPQSESESESEPEQTQSAEIQTNEKVASSQGYWK